MRDKLFLIAIIFPIVLGCGLADRVQKAVSDEPPANSTVSNTSANKTLTDQAVDTAVGEKKIGIPECDEALELLAAQANDPNDNFVVKAGKKTALNMFREQLKNRLEENKTNKQEVANFCKQFRDDMRESLEEEANSNKTP
jgi:hypothetical protein